MTSWKQHGLFNRSWKTINTELNSIFCSKLINTIIHKTKKRNQKDLDLPLGFIFSTGQT